MRYRSRILLLLIMLMAGVCGCSKEDGQGTTAPQANRPPVQNEGMISVLRSGKLRNFASATIGEAFDRYEHLVNKEWKAVPQPGGVYIIDFAGWLESDGLSEQDRRNGVMRKGLGVTFIINADGSYSAFIASTIEASADGRLRRGQTKDVGTVLSRIYANKKIDL